MIVSCRAGDWERHQRCEINRGVKQITAVKNRNLSCMPLYPGSMLFNQIALIGVDGSSGINEFPSPRFESLDAVYEALGYPVAVEVSAETLIVDCQFWWTGLELALTAEIEKHCLKNPAKANVVLLSDQYSTRLKEICDMLSVKFNVISPRWWCAASLLCLYRNAAHVVFVDTARALDAAMIGVPCSLIAGDVYSNNPVFPALHTAIARLNCCRMILPHQKTNKPVPDMEGIFSVENTRYALQSAMTESLVDTSASCVNDSCGTDPVVRTGVLWQQLWRRKVANTTVSTRRKARKLMEDPRAFFKDSTLPGSSAVAALFPEPVRAIDVDPEHRRAS